MADGMWSGMQSNTLSVWPMCTQRVSRWAHESRLLREIDPLNEAPDAPGWVAQSPWISQARFNCHWMWHFLRHSRTALRTALLGCLIVWCIQWVPFIPSLNYSRILAGKNFFTLLHSGGCSLLLNLDLLLSALALVCLLVVPLASAW